MTDDKKPPNLKDRTEHAKPEQVGQQAQESCARQEAQPDQRRVPGRRPLFRS
jgi:hypothetical protein